MSSFGRTRSYADSANLTSNLAGSVCIMVFCLINELLGTNCAKVKKAQKKLLWPWFFRRKSMATNRIKLHETTSPLKKDSHHDIQTKPWVSIQQIYIVPKNGDTITCLHLRAYPPTHLISPCTVWSVKTITNYLN